MYLFGESKLFKEPIKITEKLSQIGTEMSTLQLSMLCGLIKEYKPKKIVEVGVSAGGTTAVILNCISMLELDTEVYSVDTLEYYYQDKSKKSGYLAEECKPFLRKRVSHKMFVGYLPDCLEDIGGDIDFLILDTVHTLPGEIFDFLAAFPKLKEDAVVVLHDIFLNHYEYMHSYATRVLLSAVVGEKIIGRGNDGFFNYIGLGAFKITPDTGKYIENLFSALMITWRYMPDLTQIEIYRNWFLKYYSDDLLEEFNSAVELNKITLPRANDNNWLCINNVITWIKGLEDKENIYIYGCGKYGKKVCFLLENFGIEVKGFVISDDEVKPQHIDKRVEYISDMDNKECTMVLAMSIANQKEVCKDAIPKEWICINEEIINACEVL